MPAQRIDQLGSLPNEEIARAEDHGASLLRLGLDRDKAHGGSRSRLCDRLGVGRIVLLTFDEWLHIGRRYQANLVPELTRRPAPLMGSCASLHRHHASRLLSEERPTTE